ncbi:MAG: hypothetical protein HRU41_26285 [Saprospiraceae bacterium]|nr:hypothetical protein [Saprospiraceae bacterium]
MEDSLYIHNAGLVILGPFLPRYFSELDMLEDKQFRSIEDAERAVLLLQYLCAGQTEMAEHLLVFNKVLCGLSISDPVPIEIELTDLEQEVSHLLFHSVLQNWEQMKNSSVENLQASFLLREGLLREEDNGWTLHVESAGYDILLEFLPWTLSIVSLPWMTKRIEVVWPTRAQ